MKKGILLNSQISAVIADMGHFDTLGIGDAGMPVPNTTKKNRFSRYEKLAEI